MSDTQPQPSVQAPSPAKASGSPEPFRVLENELVISNQGEDFAFRIPTPLDTVRMGLVMRQLRKEVDPDGDSSAEGIDPWTGVFMQVIALFLVSLIRTSATWVHKAGKDGKPTIGWREWEQDKTARLFQIWADYQAGMSRFHERGTSSGEPEAPAGG